MRHTKQYSFVPTLISILIWSAIGLRTGIMEDSSGETIISMLVWAFGLITFFVGIFLHLSLDYDEEKYKPPILLAAIFFWSGFATIAGYLIGSWP